MIKKILLFLFALVALFFIVAAFVDGKYAVEKEITIDASKDRVFDYVKYQKNQADYTTWAQKDPNMEVTFEGVDGTVGAIRKWESDNENVGKGEQEIKKIIEGEKIESELRFFEPFEATDQAYMTTEAISENKTKVKWGFYGEMPYPMNIMMLFMNMEEMVGGDLQTGLNNLKKVLESEDEMMMR